MITPDLLRMLAIDLENQPRFPFVLTVFKDGVNYRFDNPIVSVELIAMAEWLDYLIDQQEIKQMPAVKLEEHEDL